MDTNKSLNMSSARSYTLAEIEKIRCHIRDTDRTEAEQEYRDIDGATDEDIENAEDELDTLSEAQIEERVRTALIGNVDPNNL